MGSLTDAAVRRAKEGRLSDGAGLLLTVRESGARFWSVRVMRDGRRFEIGLGTYPAVSLAAARAKAAELRDGIKTGRL